MAGGSYRPDGDRIGRVGRGRGPAHVRRRCARTAAAARQPGVRHARRGGGRRGRHHAAAHRPSPLARHREEGVGSGVRSRRVGRGGHQARQAGRHGRPTGHGGGRAEAQEAAAVGRPRHGLLLERHVQPHGDAADERAGTAARRAIRRTPSGGGDGGIRSPDLGPSGVLPRRLRVRIRVERAPVQGVARFAGRVDRVAVDRAAVPRVLCADPRVAVGPRGDDDGRRAQVAAPRGDAVQSQGSQRARQGGERGGDGADRRRRRRAAHLVRREYADEARTGFGGAVGRGTNPACPPRRSCGAASRCSGHRTRPR